jgi:hypothetical protein
MADEYQYELRKLGVNPLSGEGCQLSTRLDTDVSPEAVPLVESYLGGVTLNHSGYNGWAKDPEGVWHPGRSYAWDYENKCRREGWETSDGKCFKLPRTMIDELLVYLILWKDPEAWSIVYVQGKRVDNWGIINGRLMVMTRDEHTLFSEAYHSEESPYNKGSIEREAICLHRQTEEYGVKWRLFNNTWRGSNTHAWSGKNIS